MRISLVLCVSFALAAAVLWGCISAQQSYARIPPGMWRGVLALEKFQIPAKDKEEVVLVHEDIKPGQLPFNFEVKYLDDERFVVEIINGDERIRCDSIQYGRDRSQARDTLNIHFPEYQSYIHAEVRGAFMKGEWVVTTKENYRIPFTAQAGQAFRFTSLTEAPVGDLSGEWAALFDIASDEPYKAIGEFKQQQ
ncbi:MAG TPA: TlpA family protein disulfide reductase, partial [Saprospiraceae bacterium]|nr:TlpA family protein disulfide reductase [Saprospiraceae bacterium]